MEYLEVRWRPPGNWNEEGVSNHSIWPSPKPGYLDVVVTVTYSADWRLVYRREQQPEDRFPIGDLETALAPEIKKMHDDLKPERIGYYFVSGSSTSGRKDGTAKLHCFAIMADAPSRETARWYKNPLDRLDNVPE